MGRKKRRKKAGLGKAAEKWQLWICCLLFLLAVCLYVNTLGHEFVFDDVTLILQNPEVVSLDWWGIFVEAGYRPVRTFTYALNFALGGSDPWGYHFVNLLLHAFNVVLAYLFFFLLTRSNLIAGVGGLLFTVHPVQTAAVAYVSGRKDLLVGLFLLVGLCLYIGVRRKLIRPGWLWATFFVFFLAVLSKEVAIIFPGLLGVIDSFLVWRETLKRDESVTIFGALWVALKRSPSMYGAFSVLAGLALYWAMFINQASRMEGYWGGSPGANLGTAFKLFLHYLKLAFFPYPLIADYSGGVFEVSTGLLEVWTLVPIALTIVFVSVSLWLFKRNAAVSVGMLWFVITLSPVLHFVPFHEIAADHFLYVPSVGACLLGGLGFSYCSGRLVPQKVAAVLLSGIVILAGIVVVRRNMDWQNRRSLWEATYKQAPNSYRANTNLGLIHLQEGRTEEGIRLTRRSIELEPEVALPYGNLGAAYYTMAQRKRLAGDLTAAVNLQEQAIESLSKAIELEPKNPFTLSNLGNAYKELALIYDARHQSAQGHAARLRAEELYEKAVRIPDKRLAVQAIWLNYGGLFVDAGRYEEAIGYYHRYLGAFPDDPRGYYWMGYCRFKLGRYQDAVHPLLIAVQSRPTAENWEIVAKCFDEIGRASEAISSYQELLKLEPDSVEVLLRLADLYVMTDELDMAGAAIEDALKLDRTGVHFSEVKSLMGKIDAERRRSRTQ